MRIDQLIWPEDRIAHLARHAVSPEEMEEVCFGNPLVLRARSEGPNPVYYCLGQTEAGRYLFCVVIEFPPRQWISGNRAPDDGERETPLPKVERPMKKSKLPNTDSIQKLAEFWDTHDLTDFADELEEVTEPVFVRGAQRAAAIKVPLQVREAKAVERMAQAKGLSREELIRAWVLQKIARRSN